MLTGLHKNAYKFKLNHLVKMTLDATLMSDVELLYFRVIGREFFQNFDFDSMSVGDVQLACICLACTIKECIQDILLERNSGSLNNEQGYTYAGTLLAKMEEELQAIITYVTKYHF